MRERVKEKKKLIYIHTPAGTQTYIHIDTHMHIFTLFITEVRSCIYVSLSAFQTIPMDTSSSIRQGFDVEIPRGKFVEFISILKGNCDIDSTWIFRPGFDFQNRQNIDEFSTWIFLVSTSNRCNFCTRCFHSIIF